jgi:Prolyl oligopeptidase, N-terminal beta-propeller domain
MGEKTMRGWIAMLTAKRIRLCTRAFIMLVQGGLLPWMSAHGATVGPPATERDDVSDTFFGQTVVDRYRWLEDWHQDKAAHWLKAQDDYTRAALGRIPGRGAFLKRVQALDTASTKVRNLQIWGGKTFYLKARRHRGI